MARPTEAPDPPQDDPGPPDPVGDAVASFLADLLDRSDLRGSARWRDPPPRDAGLPLIPTSSASRDQILGQLEAGDVPPELSDLPRAAARAMERMTRSSDEAAAVYPSIAKAIQDVVIVEVLADRLTERIGLGADADSIATLVATAIDYFSELGVTRYEGFPVTHGAVIASDAREILPVSPPVLYPGRLPTRKRTPLLFDGTESVLVLLASGRVLAGFGRESVPYERDVGSRVELFEELAGLGGSLTAAASAAFHGIGLYLGSDRSLWVFDDGTPLFIRRTGRWKSIAIQSFVASLSRWGRTDEQTAERVARAAIRLSVQGRGAVLAVAGDGDVLDGHLEPPRTAHGTLHQGASVDDELSRLIPRADPVSSRLMARLARIDGATIVDRRGHLLAYGAIVNSSPGNGQGARTAAARSLSMAADVAVSVSQDGPITVFVDGDVALDLL